MKSAEVILSWSLDVKCPYCGSDIDLSDQDEEGYLSGPIFNNEWNKAIGLQVHCPDCSRDFLIKSVEC